MFSSLIGRSPCHPERNSTTVAASNVQALFNGKARSWRRKYGPGGALNLRLEQFTAQLPEVCLRPGDVLDLGCGTGDIAVAIAQMGYQVTACDFADSMIGVARSNWAETTVRWVSLDPGWRLLPFEDGGFGCVVAASVFEYLDDLQGVTAEIARVLRPGGVLLFSVPNPFSRIRRAEALLRRVSRGDGPSFVTRRFARIHAYMSYLRLSRNRFPGERWKAVLAQAGLLPVDEREFAEETWRRLRNETLVLLTARKAKGRGEGLTG